MVEELTASAEIAAPPSVVWAVLADLPRYGEWNPFTPRAEGRLAVGESILLHIQLGRAARLRTQSQRIVELSPERALVWETRVLHPALLRASRLQSITALAAGGTRYDSRDRMEGVLVPLVMGLYRRSLVQGFSAMAEALRRRAEQLAAGLSGRP